MTSYTGDKTPFDISVPQPILDDLSRRLAAARWPDEPRGAGWTLGTNLAYLRSLVDYWRDGFDWRSNERKLAALPQFTAEVHGVRIHFVHQRGRGPAPLPLILSHGWPSTFAEFAYLVPLLADPAAHGGDPDDAFDVVVPSLPGFGFSGDFERHDSPLPWLEDLWAALMTDVLGYARFGAQGGDFGARPTTRLGRFYADRVVGIHLNSDEELPHPLPAPAQRSAEEQAFLDRFDRWEAEEGGYAHIQGTKPQTLAYGLTDSPVGLAAWIVEKYFAWSHCAGDPDRSFRRDDLLTNITLYWVTSTIQSANRYYWRNRHPTVPPRPTPPITVPCGIAHFPAEADINVPRAMVERVYRNVTRWSEMPRGGHFAALETPQLLAEDIRAFFRPLRRPSS
jgi:pimeloyl-ACP methyl ester carboxylesterase